ncbi:MAG: NADPH-dependent glutamate synthase [Anaerolineaceae bacterium]|nr:NADPH-dependent glutamate synthase [Anaerolineaceae bacterium]
MAETHLLKEKKELKNGTILEKKLIAEKIYSFWVYAPQIARKGHPGQFIILRLSEGGERVPLTIVDQKPAEGSIRLIVQAIGKSTMALAEMSEGEQILDVFGPLGNPSEIEEGGTAVIVGGGVGAAVAYPVSKALKQAGNHVITITGARSKELIILKNEIEAVSDEAYFTTDDGSYGFHGFVTQQLQLLIDSGKKISYVLAVGPLLMMRAVSEVTRPRHIPTKVSLNTIMVDGTGMCGGCRVQLGKEVRFTCVDGPEFDGHLVDFNTVINRNRAYNHPEDCRIDVQIDQIKLEEAIPEVSRGRQQMPELPVAERIRNFEEVATGFTSEQAIAEASRCLQCRIPKCVQGCPVSVPIPEFIKLIREGKAIEAGAKIKEENALPRVCGRVCPQSEQCEGSCILKAKGKTIAIGALERYCSDIYAQSSQAEGAAVKTEGRRKVAIVGSGPAGLSCAGDLIKAGCDVTVFEAFHDFGGVLRYGIPQFRLPKEIVSLEVEALKAQGVKFTADALIGATYTVKDLMEEEGFEAVFIGTGAGLPYFLNVPGESLVGVYSANEFLTRVNLMKAYEYPHVDTPILNLYGKHVAVIGAGNTALDSARVAIRLGAASSTIIYRRSEAEMPGRVEEIEHAKAEGVKFEFLRNPVEFAGDEKGWLKSIRLVKMALGEPDSSGRRRPSAIPGSEYEIPIDIVIVAIGNGSNPIIQRTTPDLAFDKHEHIVAEPETGQTSIPGVFAGGDIVTGGATVILAMGAGRKAARAILQFLNQNEEE